MPLSPKETDSLKIVNAVSDAGALSIIKIIYFPVLPTGRDSHHHLDRINLTILR